MMHFMHACAKNNYQPGANLWAWFDFSQQDSVTTESGGRIVQVADRSGQGRHLSSPSGSGLRPFYGSRTMNGRAVADFQGGQFLQFPSGATLGTSNLTLFCVYQNDQAEAWGYILQARTATNSNALRMLSHQALENGSVALIHNSLGGQLNMANGRSTAPVLAGMVRDGAVLTGYWNSHTATGVAADFAAVGVMNVGAFWNGSEWGLHLDGAIAEMLLFTRALEGAELSHLRGYMAEKWGISL